MEYLPTADDSFSRKKGKTDRQKEIELFMEKVSRKKDDNLLASCSSGGMLHRGLK